MKPVSKATRAVRLDRRIIQKPGEKARLKRAHSKAVRRYTKELLQEECYEYA